MDTLGCLNASIRASILLWFTLYIQKLVFCKLINLHGLCGSSLLSHETVLKERQFMYTSEKRSGYLHSAKKSPIFDCLSEQL